MLILMWLLHAHKKRARMTKNTFYHVFESYLCNAQTKSEKKPLSTVTFSAQMDLLLLLFIFEAFFFFFVAIAFVVTFHLFRMNSMCTRRSLIKNPYLYINVCMCMYNVQTQNNLFVNVVKL